MADIALGVTAAPSRSSRRSRDRRLAIRCGRRPRRPRRDGSVTLRWMGPIQRLFCAKRAGELAWAARRQRSTRCSGWSPSTRSTSSTPPRRSLPRQEPQSSPTRRNPKGPREAAHPLDLGVRDTREHHHLSEREAASRTVRPRLADLGVPLKIRSGSTTPGAPAGDGPARSDEMIRHRWDSGAEWRA